MLIKGREMSGQPLLGWQARSVARERGVLAGWQSCWSTVLGRAAGGAAGTAEPGLLEICTRALERRGGGRCQQKLGLFCWIDGRSLCRDHILVNLGYPFSTWPGVAFHHQTPPLSLGVRDTQPGSSKLHPPSVSASEARVTFEHHFPIPVDPAGSR